MNRSTRSAATSPAGRPCTGRRPCGGRSGSEAAAAPGTDAVATRTVSRAGPAPPDEVWERYARPALWSRWAPQIRRVETGADRIAPGLRGRVWSYARVRVRFVVERVDEPGGCGAGAWRWGRWSCGCATRCWPPPTAAAARG
ncbi:SRPBCC family protein [Streptomyces sp. NPDC058373]|uniref:SRPBCC family protein n=1 Tax=Streptomyces sp. NPDC058373 TaxID=3346465 RepID=UPI003650BB6F